jgi:hypothetical protein
MDERRPPDVRDRRVFGIAAIIVVAVLAVSLLSAAVKPFGDALGSLPVVVALLVVVTVAVLVPVLRGPRRP